MSVNPEMLILVREAEGYTVREFADKVGVNHSTLSRYEAGLIPIPSEFIQLVSSLVDRPKSYFYRSGKRYDASANFHRKRASTSVRTLKTINARINEMRLEASSLLEWAEVECTSQFFRLNQHEFGGPTGVARELRRLWQVPSGPVANVTNLIEGAGGVVFCCDFESGAVDGVSQWPIDDDSMPPVFFLNDSAPGDRVRFTLSHELGHMVMHHLPSGTLEDDADAFASAFLMPEEDIVDELKGLTLEQAAELKSRWKVSMAAIIRRAKDLKVITPEKYTQLNKRMSAIGFKKCEPVPIPREEPALFSAVFEVNRADHNRSDDELCELLCISQSKLVSRFGRGKSGLRIRFA